MPSNPRSTRETLAYGVDIRVGDTYTFDRYRLTEEQLTAFARQWDPQRFHVERAFAESGPYHGFIASGVQTIGIYQRLAVLAMFSKWHTVSGRSLRDARFLRPVRPGDTLTGSATIRSVEFDARGRALVTLYAELTNQTGKRVFSTLAEVYVDGRPGDPSTSAEV